MGELAEDFRFMKEQALKERASKEPDRIQYAVDKLTELGLKPNVYVNEVKFLYKGSMIVFYPYKGWWSGKGIGSGRGIHNLLKKLENPTRSVE